MKGKFLFGLCFFGVLLAFGAQAAFAASYSVSNFAELEAAAEAIGMAEKAENPEEFLLVIQDDIECFYELTIRNSVQIVGGGHRLLSRSAQEGLLHVEGRLLAEGLLFEGARGGALRVDGFGRGDQLSAELIDCGFTGNQKGGAGGAFIVTAGGTRLEGCRFEGNESGSLGGAAALSGAAELQNCDFIGNRAIEAGGALVCGDLTLRDCSFEGNSAEQGGAIAVSGGAIMQNALFRGNTAVSGGGAGLLYGPASLEHCEFAANGALGETGRGGALALLGGGTLKGCSFLGNRAQDGAALWLAARLGDAEYALYDGLFEQNAAEASGAIVALQAGGEGEASLRVEGENRFFENLGAAVLAPANRPVEGGGRLIEEGRDAAPQAGEIAENGAGWYLVETSGGSLNLRAKPSGESALCGRLARGGAAHVLGFEGNWAKIQKGDRVVYAYGAYLKAL
ncbi:MAG: right-handed parallel beta-helix repeat-containing protein [Christensenellaceae bacterium]|jgi:predicted outer membrane repeat protein|nr:right-handed parallel beta-helix repeat-containing protein [Christensenellaceae bacterium]